MNWDQVWDESDPRIRTSREFFSPHFGKPCCTECEERAYELPHTCRPACEVCGQRMWRKVAKHERCCDHPATSRADWQDIDIRRAHNGALSYYLACHDCGKNFSQKHADVPGWAKQAPLRADNAGTSHPCARCKSQFTEYHHFAPRAIFTDADRWPGAWLCKPCHQLWHSAMREAGGYRLGTTRHCDWANDASPYDLLRDLA